MSIRSVSCLLLLGSGLLLATASIQGEGHQLPDPLNSETVPAEEPTGLSVTPVAESGLSGQQPLTPETCRVHLTRLPRAGLPKPGSEYLYPCFESFLPPPGQRYLVWVEGGESISTSVALIGIPAGIQTGNLPLHIPVARAGKILLPGDFPDEDLDLRIFRAQATPTPTGSEAHPIAWSRSEPLLGLQGETLLAPGGQVLAALWSPRDRQYRAISRPFEVEPGQTTEIPWHLEAKQTDLFVRLRRVEWPLDKTAAPVRLELLRDGRSVPPDLTVPSFKTVHAVWYGVEPGEANLRAESDSQGLASIKLDLPEGEIVAIEEQLLRRPALDLQLSVPSALDAADDRRLTVELQRLPEMETQVLLSLPPGERFHQFTRLPLAIFRVLLHSSAGSFETEVDLRSGDDTFHLFEPPMAAVRGSVSLGGKAHEATLHLSAIGQEAVSVDTDSDGRYEAILAGPLLRAEIALKERDSPPWIEIFPLPLSGSHVVDFELNDAQVRVRVIDHSTGKPLPGATVAFKNLFTGRTETEQTTAQHWQTDNEGLLLLPPLREGVLELQARAPGYYRMPEALRFPISESSTDEVVELALLPIRETVPVSLILPSGLPAATAKAIVVRSLSMDTPLLTATSDEDGRIELPGPPLEAIVLIRHPAAALFLREWRPAENDSERQLTWSLAPPAPQPFQLRLFDEDDEPSHRQAGIALWVDGNRLTGGLLAWLTSRAPLTDGQGFWSAINLPAADIKVLGWARHLQEDAFQGGLDMFAETVTFPWPTTYELEVQD